MKAPPIHLSLTKQRTTFVSYQTGHHSFNTTVVMNNTEKTEVKVQLNTKVHYKPLKAATVKKKTKHAGKGS